jgi:hypothetical protein
VGTEMCCPKDKCGCQYVILLTLRKKNPGLNPHGKRMHVKEIYVIFIHLFDSGILLIIDLNKKKGKRGE